MRRAEFEITDEKEIDDIVMSCDCLRLGLNDGGYPYIVPVNFGFRRRGRSAVFYFHGAPSGKKADLINADSNAGFELDTAHRLVVDERAERYSYRYASVIGSGKVERITDRADKRTALLILMRHYAADKEFTLSDSAVDATAVFKLTVLKMTAKRRQ